MEPGISSAGRPVSTPTDTFLSIDFLAELFFSKEFAQALIVDANTQLGEELKDVRVQLSNSVKENRQLRHGIYSKCLSKLF